MADLRFLGGRRLSLHTRDEAGTKELYMRYFSGLKELKAAGLSTIARLPFSIHPHMLRHAAGYKLANGGHDTRAIQQYLGHKNIQHTVRYTEMICS